MGGKATQMGSGTNPEKLRQQHLAKKYGWDSKYKADYKVRLGEKHTVVRHGPDKHISQSGRLIGKNAWSTKMNPHEFDKIHGGTMSAYGELQQIEKEKLPRLQSQGKTTLLTNQTTRKGGGKSGGGGGKFGWIRRMVNRPASPFSLLRTDKNF